MFELARAISRGAIVVSGEARKMASPSLAELAFNREVNKKCRQAGRRASDG